MTLAQTKRGATRLTAGKQALTSQQKLYLTAILKMLTKKLTIRPVMLCGGA